VPTAGSFQLDCSGAHAASYMVLDAAVGLEDLRILTSNYLEKLSGDRSGQF
jgi:plasmid maintenance system killer protein